MNKRPEWQSWFGNLVIAFFFGAGLGFSLCYALFVSGTGGEQPAQTTAQSADTPSAAASPDAATNQAEDPSAAKEDQPKEDAAREPLDESLWVARHLFIAVEGKWLSQDTRALLRAIRPGGVILRPSNINTATQTRSLVREIKEAAAMGGGFADLPLIAVAPANTLGGGVQLADMPNAGKLGAEGDEAAARGVGNRLARAAADRGINMLLGPVFDVYESGSAFPEFEAHCFGSDRSLVTRLGLAVTGGVMEGGVIPAAAHFPGYGAAQRRAEGPGLVLEKDIRGLAELMYPFSEAIGAGAPAVLVGHVAVPALDKDHPQRPASRSPKLIQEILRDRFGFEGVVIADDITAPYAALEDAWVDGAADSLAAGADAVIVGESDLERVYALCRALEDAVKSGRLDNAHLQQSRTRLNELQAWLQKPERLERTQPRYQVAANDEPDAAEHELDELEPSEPRGEAEPLSLDDVAPVAEETDDASDAGDPAEPSAPDQSGDEASEASTPAGTTDVEAPAETGQTPEDKASEGQEPAEESATEEERTEAAAGESADAQESQEAPVPAESESQPSSQPEDEASPETADTDTPAGEGSDAVKPADAEATPPEPEVGTAEGEPEEPSESAPDTATPDAGETPPEDADDSAAPDASGTPPSNEGADSPTQESSETEEAPSGAADEDGVDQAAGDTNAGDGDEAAAPEAEDEGAADEPSADDDSAPASTGEGPSPEGEAAAEAPADEPASTTPDAESQQLATLQHTVQPGETLAQIARQYDVTASQIVGWNELDGVDVSDGMTIEVRVPASMKDEYAEAQQGATEGLEQVTHEIQRGETLTSIAQRYNVDVRQLVVWNGLANPYVKAGDTLKVYLGPSDEVERITEQATKELEENITTYRVQPGDTLLKIARKLGTTQAALMEINQIDDPNHVVIGQTLKVPWKP